MEDIIETVGIKYLLNFGSFQVRLSNININAIRRFGKSSSVPEHSDTFLSEALQKWSELNCTQNFVDFRNELVEDVHTLPQLIHHKEQVVEALVKHLQIPKSLALPPLLDLVVQLAKDLQGEFYVHFEEIFKCIVNILNIHHHDVEVLEQGFTCLAHLFKFLWRHMVNDMKNVYTLFCPLLSDTYKEYINNFASESFSFLMRKVKDYDGVFDLIFESLEENSDHSGGVGKLLFETIHGVQEQFHTSTETILPVLLDKLGNSSLPQTEVRIALHDMWLCMAKYTNQEHSQMIWKILLKLTTEVHCKWRESSKESEKENLHEHLHGLLELLYLWVSYKSGSLVGDAANIVQLLLELLRGDLLQDEAAEVLLSVVAAVLLAENCQIEPYIRPRLITLIFKSSYERDLIFSFVRQVHSLSLFEKDMLPGLLGYCQTCAESNDSSAINDILHALCSLLLHQRPPSKTEVDLSEMECYLLDFSSLVKSRKKKTVSNQIMQQLQAIANNMKKKTESVDEPLLWALSHCLPHIRPIDAEKAVKLLSEILQMLFSRCEDSAQDGAILHLIPEIISSLYLLNGNSEAFINSISIDALVLLIKNNSENVQALRAGDIYFTALKATGETDNLNGTILEQVYSALEQNLSSPYSQIRLLSLHIICCFHLPMPVIPSDMNLEQPGVFQICLDAEKAPISVHSYREKTVHLGKLAFDLVQNQMPVGDYEQVPLRYLLGALYINFRLLWKPIIELIKSHAYGLKPKVFWEIFGAHLQKTATLAAHTLLDENKQPSQSEEENEEDGEPGSLLEDMYSDYKEAVISSDRPDPFNFRHLLWQAMQEFSDVCEPKSRLLVPLLFQFLENEYYAEDTEAAFTQNILKSSENEVTDKTDDTTIDSHLDEEVEDDLDEENEDRTRKKKSNRKRAPTKTLVIHLALFGKFKDPKALYMEPKLKSLYSEFLEHRDATIQKAAFDALMTYQHKYLVPYKENFEKLIDDKSFRSQLVMFAVDEEITVIEKDHRPGVMYILMRILHGKLHRKAGKRSRIGQSHQTRSSILNFLAGLHPDELAVFLDLVFGPFSHFISDNVFDKVSEVTETLDLTSIMPLRKQAGALNIMELVIKKLGQLIEPYLPKLLQLLLCLAAVSSRALEMRDRISPNATNMLKMIRNITLLRLNQFIGVFDQYSLGNVEVKALFKVAVWPQLSLLHQEGVYSPTPLLKLCQTWSQQTRYIPLLLLHMPDNPNQYPLPAIFKLLIAPNTNQSVTKIILQIIENLLNMSEEDKMDTDDDNSSVQTVISLPNMAPIPDDNELSFGIRMILPHVSVILQYLGRVVEKMSKMKKRQALPRQELSILSKLSTFVTDSDQSQEIVRLLLPFLGRRLIRNLDTEMDILTATANLLRQSHNPEQFLGTIAELFSFLKMKQSRLGLCEAVKAIAEKYAPFATLAKVVVQINSFDRVRVDEPDYMQRLEGFESAGTLLKEKPDEIMMLMLVHNCCFFLSTTDDLALRESASDCLLQLLNRLSECHTTEPTLYKLVIINRLLPEVKTHIRSSKENIRNQFITILSHLVKLFPSRPTFSGLVPLRNDNEEVDFFSSMTHIQIHRRARAMRRLSQHIASNTVPHGTVTGYLLPMVGIYLTDDTYKKTQTVVDGAIDVISATARFLPWGSYQVLLQHYLERLPKSLKDQKLMIRVVIAILDNFHFDLRNSTGVEMSNFYKKTKFGGRQRRNFAAGNKGRKDKNLKGQFTERSKEEKNKQMDESDDVSKEDEATGEENMEDDAMEVDDIEETTPEDIAKKEFTDDGKLICKPALATRIHRNILKGILPKLHKCLTKKVKSEVQHKMAAAGKYAEDEEILRVPIALAMVKLLKGLPSKTLDQNLPRILLKVCQFVKSRSRDIRNTSRNTLVQILQALGPSYLGYILKELHSVLQRGYQLHVLCYTVWTLLCSLLGSLKPGQLDSSMELLIEILNNELFGEVAEEKEVDGITTVLFEARSSKSTDSYGILARYASERSLTWVVAPLKSTLETTRSHTTANKVTDVLKKICIGLVDNKGLTLNTLMTFVYGLTTEALPMLKPQKPSQESQEQKPGERPQSTYIVPVAPPRGGVKPKTHMNTNMHILVEFAIQVLNKLLKRNRIQQTKIDHLEMLDPFVHILSGMLKAKHVKVTSVALRCFLLILKFPLPAMKQHINSVCVSVFGLLNTYATAGAAKGDNFELVIMCFKVMTSIVRDVSYHKINKDQLHVLLTYCEMDVHDHNRQTTAFTLLKAILHRKLVVQEMYEIIEKVEQLSITADSPHTRLCSRQVVMQFLLDYPIGKKLRTHLEFYVAQMDYEHESGRISALEMMAAIFNKFPEKILSESASFFFIPLCSRLVNDDSTKCRKIASMAIKSLLHRLDSEQRDLMFNMCIGWFGDFKVSLQRLAALVCGIIVEVETAGMERHLSVLLPIISDHILPEKYDLDSDDSREEKEKDHMLFGVLTLLQKLLRTCHIMRKPKWTQQMNTIWGSVEKLLVYPHAWVRLVSSQLFGLLFGVWNPQDLLSVELQSNKKQPTEYLQINLNEKLYDLCGSFCKQMASTLLDKELAEQVVKNAIFLARILKELPDDFEKTNVDESNDDKKSSLGWLVRKMCKQAKLERANQPRITIKRSSVFKWCAAVAMELDAAKLESYLPAMMPPLTREYIDSSQSADEKLKSLCQEVMDLLKERVGVKVFSNNYASVHKKIDDHKQERKQRKAVEAVSDPAKAALRKMKKQMAHTEAKKRKVETFRTSKMLKSKKRKLKHTETGNVSS